MEYQAQRKKKLKDFMRKRKHRSPLTIQMKSKAQKVLK